MRVILGTAVMAWLCLSQTSAIGYSASSSPDGSSYDERLPYLGRSTVRPDDGRLFHEYLSESPNYGEGCTGTYYQWSLARPCP
jgi:hypothetical protein